MSDTKRGDVPSDWWWGLFQQAYPAFQDTTKEEALELFYFRPWLTNLSYEFWEWRRKDESDAMVCWVTGKRWVVWHH